LLFSDELVGGLPKGALGTFVVPVLDDTCNDVDGEVVVEGFGNKRGKRLVDLEGAELFNGERRTYVVHRGGSEEAVPDFVSFAIGTIDLWLVLV